MKTFTRISFLIFLFFISISAYSQSKYDLLFNFQEKVDSLNNVSAIDNSTLGLESLCKHLEELPEGNAIVNYWQAYVHFLISVIDLKSAKNDDSKTHLDTSISILESIQNKDSEVLALLSYIQGFSINFVKGMEAGVISRKASLNAQCAREMDNKNPRAYFVSGMMDLYTPKEYGGMLKCEEYLLKSISLEEPNMQNPYLPRWGREDAYTLLINHYLRQSQVDKAKSLYQDAIAAFPNSHSIKSFSNSF